MTVDRHDHTSNGFVMGMLCGVAVGAAVALLFAPTDGRHLRGKIGDSAKWLGHESKDMYEAARRTVGDAVTAGRDAFQKTRSDNVRAEV